MHHIIRAIYQIDEHTLSVLFVEGITKVWDFSPWYDKYPTFRKLKEHPELFDDPTVDVGGAGIVWSDELDMDCNTIFDEGVETPSVFDGLISFSEATILWDLNESTLRKALAYGKLKPGIDACKFGGTWIVKKEAMVREYGPERN